MVFQLCLGAHKALRTLKPPQGWQEPWVHQSSFTGVVMPGHEATEGTICLCQALIATLQAFQPAHQTALGLSSSWERGGENPQEYHFAWLTQLVPWPRRREIFCSKLTLLGMAPSLLWQPGGLALTPRVRCTSQPGSGSTGLGQSLRSLITLVGVSVGRLHHGGLGPLCWKEGPGPEPTCPKDSGSQALAEVVWPRGP